MVRSGDKQKITDGEMTGDDRHTVIDEEWKMETADCIILNG